MNIVELRNIQKFTRATKEKARQHRGEVNKSLAESLDNIRMRAVKYIIPIDKSKVNKKMSPYRMSKLQPPASGRLTERTGALIEMLKSKGKWSFGGINNKTYRLRTHSIRGMVKTDSGFNTLQETTLGTLYVDIQDSNPFVGKAIKGSARADMFAGKRRVIYGRLDKKVLAMRFRWETGIRGQKREFISPSLQEEKFKVSGITKNRLNSLGGTI